MRNIAVILGKDGQIVLSKVSAENQESNHTKKFIYHDRAGQKRAKEGKVTT